MRSILSALAVLATSPILLASPVQYAPADQVVFGTTTGSTAHPRPLVIWHGLGDTALSDGISAFIEEIKSVHPGIFVHSVQIPEGGSLDAERKAGFFGKMEEQAQDGCDQLKRIDELKGGFDAMGFSQGGLYLRNYAQYCNDPPIRNLITFGTPHYGISALIPCPTPPTLTCMLAARAARLGIYTEYSQDHLVQAQYYRDVERLDEFMAVNTFLRDINGDPKGMNDTALEALPCRTAPAPAASEDGDERDEHDRAHNGKNEREGGGQGLTGLENFIAVMFDADRTVSPAQSAHFWTYAPGNKTLLVPLQEQPLYKHDWIGLRALDERGGLQLAHCPGEHMDLGTGDCGMNVVKAWVGWDRESA